MSLLIKSAKQDRNRWISDRDLGGNYFLITLGNGHQTVITETNDAVEKYVATGEITTEEVTQP